VVGDLAQFMVQNDLDEHSMLERAAELNFPQSVVEFLQGMLGQPEGGFPEPLRSRVIKELPRMEGRPGANMAPANLEALEASLKEKHGGTSISYRDVLSASLYPKVFDEFKAWTLLNSQFTEKLPTRAFLLPMEEDDELEVELSKGNTVTLKYKAISELQPNGTREVFFETNGVPRVVEVLEVQSEESKSGGRAVREKGDPTKMGSVSAPMSGDVLEVKIKAGEEVKAGQGLIILSAMKMETSVAAPCTGVVRHVAVDNLDAVEAGDLLVLIDPKGSGESDEEASSGQQSGNGTTAGTDETAVEEIDASPVIDS
jgi:pyruvate carboxylase